MILSEHGKLKILIEKDQAMSLPDPQKCINGDVLSIESWEIFAAILSCGCIPSEYIPHNISKRIDELVYKCAVINFALKEDKGYVVWDVDNISKLDPSEKVFVSYYIGMFFGTLISRKLYGIDYLCHFKKFISYSKSVLKHNGKKYKGSHSEPDFIGMKYSGSNVDFSLFEAKGGENIRVDVTNKALSKQLCVVKTILGKSPRYRILCYSAYNKGTFKSVSENALKIRIAEGNMQGRRNLFEYDVENSLGSVKGLFRKEITELTEELISHRKVSERINGLGKFELDQDNNKQILVIEYSETDAVKVIIGEGDDISVEYHKTGFESVTIKEKASIIDGDTGRVIYKSKDDT